MKLSDSAHDKNTTKIKDIMCLYVFVTIIRGAQVFILDESHIILMNVILGTTQDKAVQRHAWIYNKGNMDDVLILPLFQI